VNVDDVHCLKRRILSFAQEIVLAAGRLAVEHLGYSRTVADKRHRDIQTSTDLACSELLVTRIKQQFPGHAILIEEDQFSVRNDSPWRWVIDPLDGTVWHRRSLADFGTMLALEHQRQVVYAAIYIPAQDRICWAFRGDGAYVGSHGGGQCRRIELDPPDSLDQALAALEVGKSLPQRTQAVALYRALLENCRAVRTAGSAVDGYCLASGGIDVLVSNSHNWWDNAPVAFLAEQAGLTVTDLAGQQVSETSKSMLIAPQDLHNKLLQILPGTGREPA